MVDQHDSSDEVNLVMSCNYQADITYKSQKHFECGNPVIDKFVRSSLKRSVVTAIAPRKPYQL